MTLEREIKRNGRENMVKKTDKKLKELDLLKREKETNSNAEVLAIEHTKNVMKRTAMLRYCQRIMKMENDEKERNCCQRRNIV